MDMSTQKGLKELMEDYNEEVVDYHIWMLEEFLTESIDEGVLKALDLVWDNINHREDKLVLRVSSTLRKEFRRCEVSLRYRSGFGVATFEVKKIPTPSRDDIRTCDLIILRPKDILNLTTDGIKEVKEKNKRKMLDCVRDIGRFW